MTFLENTQFVRIEYSFLKLAQKNRPKTKALNFTYTSRSGRQRTLDQIPTDYTILFINNPGCHAYTETINQLKNAQLTNKLIEDKRLAILTVYPDENLESWKQPYEDFSRNWINGYDKEQNIANKELYDSNY